MTTTLRDVLQFINSCDASDHKTIASALSFKRALKNDEARFRFLVGDRVQFKVNKRPYYGAVVRGVLVKKNRTTFHVRPDGGGREWRVSIALIQKEEPAKPADKT